MPGLSCSTSALIPRRHSRDHPGSEIPVLATFSDFWSVTFGTVLRALRYDSWSSRCMKRVLGIVFLKMDVLKGRPEMQNW